MLTLASIITLFFSTAIVSAAEAGLMQEILRICHHCPDNLFLHGHAVRFFEISANNIHFLAFLFFPLMDSDGKPGQRYAQPFDAVFSLAETGQHLRSAEFTPGIEIQAGLQAYRAGEISVSFRNPWAGDAQASLTKKDKSFDWQELFVIHGNSPLGIDFALV